MDKKVHKVSEIPGFIIIKKCQLFYLAAIPRRGELESETNDENKESPKKIKETKASAQKLMITLMKN